MGDRLHHTLINPNQLRSYGVDVQDNLFAKEDLALQRPTTSFHWTHKAPQFSVTRDLQQKSNCSSYQESYLHLQSTGIYRKCNSLLITQTGLFQTPPHNAHVTLVFIKQHTTRSIFLPGLSNKFMLTGQTGNRTQPYDKTFLLWTFQSRECHSGIAPADISEQWYVGLSQANNTLNATTQQLVHSALLPLSHRYQVDRMYEHLRIRGTIYTDTMGDGINLLTEIDMHRAF